MIFGNEINPWIVLGSSALLATCGGYFLYKKHRQNTNPQDQEPAVDLTPVKADKASAVVVEPSGRVVVDLAKFHRVPADYWDRALKNPSKVLGPLYKDPFIKKVIDDQIKMREFLKTDPHHIAEEANPRFMEVFNKYIYLKGTHKNSFEKYDKQYKEACNFFKRVPQKYQDFAEPYLDDINRKLEFYFNSFYNIHFHMDSSNTNFPHKFTEFLYDTHAKILDHKIQILREGKIDKNSGMEQQQNATLPVETCSIFITCMYKYHTICSCTSAHCLLLLAFFVCCRLL